MSLRRGAVSSLSSSAQAQGLLYQRLSVLREQWNAVAVALQQQATALLNGYLKLQHFPQELAAQQSSAATAPDLQRVSDTQNTAGRTAGDVSGMKNTKDREERASERQSTRLDGSAASSGIQAGVSSSAPGDGNPEQIHGTAGKDESKSPGVPEMGAVRAALAEQLSPELGPQLSGSLERLTGIYAELQELLTRRNKTSIHSEEGRRLRNLLTGYRKSLFLKGSIVDQLLTVCVRGDPIIGEDPDDPEQRIRNEGLELLLTALSEQIF